LRGRHKKWKPYFVYRCYCEKPACKCTKPRKDGSFAPRVGKISKVPVCNAHFTEEAYAHLEGGHLGAHKARRNRHKRKNWETLCFLYYGEFVPFKKRTCLYSGDLIYKKKINQKDFCNLSDIHHLHVSNKSSTHKREKEPAAMIAQATLSSEDIIELMGTVVVNTQWHKYMHDHYKNIDYRILKKSQMPYVLRSERNFIKICTKFKLKMVYNTFMGTLKNNKMPQHLIHKDWL
jgi:hypothetical protein